MNQFDPRAPHVDSAPITRLVAPGDLLSTVVRVYAAVAKPWCRTAIVHLRKDRDLTLLTEVRPSSGTGYVIDFAGPQPGLTIEGRRTLCNMSIEMARDQV